MDNSTLPAAAAIKLLNTPCSQTTIMNGASILIQPHFDYVQKKNLMQFFFTQLHVNGGQ
jgi:hypothetical protein